MIEAVGATPWDTASTVAAMVEGDHPVVAGQVGDLVCPGPDGADETVRQHNRIAVRRPEHLGVTVPSAARTVKVRLGGRTSGIWVAPLLRVGLRALIAAPLRRGPVAAFRMSPTLACSYLRVAGNR